MKVNFAHLWLAEDLSDVEVQLKITETPVTQGVERAAKRAKTESEVVRSIPAHKAILSAIPYFRVQVCGIEQHALCQAVPLL